MKRRPVSWIAVALFALVACGGGSSPTAPPTPTPVLPPPATPTQLTPADGTTFDIFPRRTTLSWTPVADAASYGLDLEYCLPPACTEGTTAAVFPIPVRSVPASYTFEFVGAQPGRWRVWAIGPTGVEGPKSPWWIFYYRQ